MSLRSVGRHTVLHGMSCILLYISYSDFLCNVSFLHTIIYVSVYPVLHFHRGQASVSVHVFSL